MLIPLIIGIVLYEWWRGEFVWIGEIAVCLSLATLICAWLIHRYVFRFSVRWMFGVTIFWAFISLGGMLSWLHDKQVSINWPDSRMNYRAFLLEMPEAKKNTVLCKVHLSVVFDSVCTSKVGRDVLVYLPKDSVSMHLGLEDELLFSAYVDSPPNRKNPYEFDYGRYLQRQGIAGVAYVDSGYWSVRKGNVPLGVKQQALCLREKVLQIYRELDFSGDVYAVLSALTVGYKEALSDDVRESYSQAGVSHVLALSGLHIGILYGLVFGLFNLFIPTYRYMPLKGVLLLLMLWAFAFISGLSASVVRSVIMFSFLVIAKIFHRQRVGLNTICIAAFFMLLWNPSYLFDVSFQLSFCAVTGIVIGVPWLQQFVIISNSFLARLCELTFVSIAAQIATFPLVLYYFSSIPLYALLLNIPVLFLTTLILWLTLLLLLMGFAPSIQHLLASVVSALVNFQNELASLVQQIPFSVIDSVPFLQADVFFSYILMGILLLIAMGWIKLRWIILETWFIALLFFHIIVYKSTKVVHPRVVYYNMSYPLIHYVDINGVSYLQGDSVKMSNYALREVEKYREMHHLDVPQWLSSDINSHAIWRMECITNFYGYRVCVINSDEWLHCVAPLPYTVDCLYLTRGFKGTLRKLTTLFAPKQVILHQSLGTYHTKRLCKECVELGIEYVLLQKEGALSVNI